MRVKLLNSLVLLPQASSHFSQDPPEMSWLHIESLWAPNLKLPHTLVEIKKADSYG